MKKTPFCHNSETFDYASTPSMGDLLLLFLFCSKNQDLKINKQNLDMIRTIVGDLYTKYYSSIMIFVQHK
jgi:hypothetical protein